MEVRDRLVGVKVVPGNPLVVFRAVSGPLYEVLRASVADPGVQDLFHVILQLAFDDHGCGWLGLLATREGIGRGGVVRQIRMVSGHV